MDVRTRMKGGASDRNSSTVAVPAGQKIQALPFEKPARHLPSQPTTSSSLPPAPVIPSAPSFQTPILIAAAAVGLTPHRVASLRGSLPRRRSSFPPSTIDQLTSAIAASSNGQPPPHAQPSIFAELGLLGSPSMWTPVGWDTLLNFDGEVKEPDQFALSKGSPSSIAGGSGMVRVLSDPGGDKAMMAGTSVGGSSRTGTGMGGPASFDLSHVGGDRAWKTILASQVEVEGVGQIGVAKVLQEVWRRGGGDQVTSQGLWPSIIISLSLPEVDSPGFRLPSPSAHAALALQNLYNVTLRHWEPSIFTGLLSSFGTQVLRGDMDLPAMLGAAAHAQQAPLAKDGGEHIFGVSTPQKELDMTQWTTLTPGTGDWSFLNSLESGPAFSEKVHAQGPSSLAYEVREPRRGSTARSIEDEGIRGLDEILAQMEEGAEAREVAAIQEQIAAASAVPDLMPSGSMGGRKRPSDDPLFQMPTPETDSSDLTVLSSRGQSSDRTRQMSFNLVTPPSSNSSPLTSHHNPLRPPGGQSALARTTRNAQLPTPTPSTQSLPQLPNGKRRNSMQLTMPMATFVPPPPMCMFFSPVFHDLQQGKVGVWKGDLEVRGKGGGKFSVLIVGEQSTGHMWQSHMWPSSVVYPPEAQANEDATATATMIPVSHLAREGFTPAAMGMVLCNDANIEAYVHMVQGLHAEGVAFHLSTPNRLPIVFLPAKFDSNDPLQRLGVAFMTKPGQPHPASIPMSAATRSATSATSSTSSHLPLAAGSPSIEGDGPKRKKRRQSAPAGTLPSPKTTAGRHRKRESAASAGMRAGAIPEEGGDEHR